MTNQRWTCSDAAIEWGLRELFAPHRAHSLVERVLVALESPAAAVARRGRAVSTRQLAVGLAAAAVLLTTWWFVRPDRTWVRLAAAPVADDDEVAIDRAALDAQWALVLTDLDAESSAKLSEETQMLVENSPAAMVFLCEGSPRSWKFVRARLSALDPSSLSPAVRERVFTCASHDPSNEGETWMRSALRRWPESFTDDALMQYATFHDSTLPDEVLRHRLVAALEADPSDPNWVYVGAHLALRGDATGRTLLEGSTGSVDPKHGPGTADRRFAAAIGLRALGDAKPWERVVDEVREAVEKGEINRELRVARWMVPRAAYFAQAIDGTRISLAYMSAPVDRFVADETPQQLEVAELRAKADALPR